MKASNQVNLRVCPAGQAAIIVFGSTDERKQEASVLNEPIFFGRNTLVFGEVVIQSESIQNAGAELRSTNKK